jgi:hypothetical protein
MIVRALKHAIPVFIGSILLGICLFGIPLAVWGAIDVWNDPVDLGGKSGATERTVIGRAAECFCVGAFLGGVAAVIPGIWLALIRLCDELDKTDPHRPKPDD